MNRSQPPVKSLGAFVDRVSELRQSWQLPKHKELWFRGESKDYGETQLRPELYRPVEPGKPVKAVSKLLEIEYDLYEEFGRTAGILADNKITEDDWVWDTYFLLQHHNGPTRLLDWSDGALMALHFALRNKSTDNCDAKVFVLEPYRLLEKLKALPDEKIAEKTWRTFTNNHASRDLDEEMWEEAYLPLNEGDRKEVSLPRPPLVLEFPNISRRFAAQRSRFIAFGSEPNWLSDELKKADSTIKKISISASSRSRVRQELRDCGVTESVIYPDLDGLGREMRQLWDDRRAAPDRPRARTRNSRIRTASARKS